MIILKDHYRINSRYFTRDMYPESMWVDHKWFHSVSNDELLYIQIDRKHLDQESSLLFDLFHDILICLNKKSVDKSRNDNV